MPKTSSKRKADAATFGDDADGEADGGGSDNSVSADAAGDLNGDNDVDSGDDDDDDVVSETLATALPENTTPRKQKTPGSSPGMVMRSGRKKKRSSSSVAAAAAPLVNPTGATPLRKRAKKSAAIADEDEDKAEDESGKLVVATTMTAPKQNGQANYQGTRKRGGGAGGATTVMDEDKKDDDEGGNYEDEVMAVEEEEGDENGEKGDVEKLAAQKAPPETTVAVAASASQVADPTTEGVRGADGGAVAAPALANGGGGGILSQVGQTLRLSSQRAPRPQSPLTLAAAAIDAHSSTPVVPPPGRRRLIFGLTGSIGGGSDTSNKLLMQTRQLPQQSQQQQQQQQHEQLLGDAHASMQSQHFLSASAGAVTLASPLARFQNETRQNEGGIKKDLLLCIKAWLLLLVLCFVIANAFDVLMTDSLASNDGVILGLWNVREQGAILREWYGLVPADVAAADAATDDKYDDDADDYDEIEEEIVLPHIVVEKVTKTDPALLSAARAALRARRANLHDISRIEHDLEALRGALDILDSSAEKWGGMHPEFEFEAGERKEKAGRASAVTDAAMKRRVLEEITSSDVVIFSKSASCPNCKAIKELFSLMKEEAAAGENTGHEAFTNFQIVEIDLDVLPNGEEILSILSEIIGGDVSVPNVFVRGRHAGGSDAVHGLADSERLREMLQLDIFEFKPGKVEGGDTTSKEIPHRKIDEMKAGISEKQKLLLAWELALGGAEEAVELLLHGAIHPNEANAAISELSRASMVPAEAMALDADTIALPGEGCEGVDYALLQPEEDLAEIEKEGEEATQEVEVVEEAVEVVGGIDVNALDYASDTPVRNEDAHLAYESLLRLAYALSEALIGANNARPSPQAKRWVQQIVVEELQRKKMDGEPPYIKKTHGPLISPEAISELVKSLSLSPSSSGETYTALDALRDIDRLLEIEDADRTGKLDHASVVHGARVVRRGPFATSSSYYESLPLLNRLLAYAGLRFYGHPPEVALLPSVTTSRGRGGCWSFPDEYSSLRAARRADVTSDGIRGEYATLTVTLSRAIAVTEVIVEHVPPNISPNPTTAIRDFRVVGFEDSGAYGSPWELGTYSFVIGPTMQAFPVPTVLEGQNVPKLKAVAIAVDSNHGGQYCCLYRVRVHGA